MTLSDNSRAAIVRAQRQLMADWSETRWCAGWTGGLEVELWHGTTKAMTPYDQDIADIHELARLTGVWCEMDRSVPLEEWQARYGPPLTRMADPDPTPEQQAAIAQVRADLRAHWERVAQNLGDANRKATP